MKVRGNLQVFKNIYSTGGLSGQTIFSGSTDLYDIFATSSGSGDVTRVQGGTNISTGGTVNAPIVNLDDNINVTSISGDSIFSGSTDLYNIFATTVTNVGGDYGLFAGKTDSIFNFKSLSAGTNIVLTATDAEVMISSIASGGSSRTTGSTQTVGDVFATASTITDLTDDSIHIIESFMTAMSSDYDEWGTWKRTLAVTKISGIVTIRDVNSDFDSLSTNLCPLSVTYSANTGVAIVVDGIVGETIEWNSSYEIITRTTI